MARPLAGFVIGVCPQRLSRQGLILLSTTLSAGQILKNRIVLRMGDPIKDIFLDWLWLWGPKVMRYFLSLNAEICLYFWGVDCQLPLKIFNSNHQLCNKWNKNKASFSDGLWSRTEGKFICFQRCTDCRIWKSARVSFNKKKISLWPFMAASVEKLVLHAFTHRIFIFSLIQRTCRGMEWQ